MTFLRLKPLKSWQTGMQNSGAHINIHPYMKNNNSLGMLLDITWTNMSTGCVTGSRCSDVMLHKSVFVLQGRPVLLFVSLQRKQPRDKHMHTYGSIFFFFFPMEESHTMRGCAANVLRTAGIRRRCTALLSEGSGGYGFCVFVRTALKTPHSHVSSSHCTICTF